MFVFVPVSGYVLLPSLLAAKETDLQIVAVFLRGQQGGQLKGKSHKVCAFYLRKDRTMVAYTDWLRFGNRES